MESIVPGALLSHLDKNNLINPNPHGFLLRHSTGSSQLLEFVNNRTDAAEQCNCIDVS